MARDSYAYRQVAVQSALVDGRVAIHPMPGQAFASTMNVQCSRRLSDTSTYPLGTCFLVDAKLTDRLGGPQYLYVWHGDEVKVLSARDAAVFLEAYRRLRL